LPAVAVAVEVAVLELDSRSVGRLGQEADLDLARLREVGLDLPVRVDVPGEHETIRRLVRNDARPLAFGAIDAAVVDATSGAWLEHRLRDVDAEHVVLARLDPIELLREDLERSVDRHVHADL